MKDYKIPNSLDITKKLNPNYYLWIDKLKKLMEIKYPGCRWTLEHYMMTAWEWRNNYQDLKVRVNKLEREMFKSNKKKKNEQL